MLVKHRLVSNAVQLRILGVPQRDCTKVEVSQPAHNVGTTLIIGCIYVATSNSINTMFSRRMVIDVTRMWKSDVATTLK